MQNKDTAKRIYKSLPKSSEIVLPTGREDYYISRIILMLTSLSLKDEMRQLKKTVAPVYASMLLSEELSSSKEGELNLKNWLNCTKLLFFTK